MKKSEALKTRTIPFVFSDETRDTYGTVLTAEGWDLSYFNKMGVALYNHDSYSSDPDNVIGTAKAWVDKDKKQLLGEITFETAEANPKAEKVFQKLLAGTIKGCSVGFRSMERGAWGEGDEAIGGKKETYYYGKRQLVEISVTPFPANPNAKVRSLKENPEAENDTETMDYAIGMVRSFEPEEPKEQKKNDTEAKEIESLRAEAKRSVLLADANIAEQF